MIGGGQGFPGGRREARAEGGGGVPGTGVVGAETKLLILLGTWC